MTLRNSSKFKIRSTDEEHPEQLITEQIDNQRFEKLNQRVTIITVLILFLIGIIIFIGYRSIIEMVSQTQDMGAKEVTSLAQSLESSLSDISGRQAKLEEAQVRLESTLAGKLGEQEKVESRVQDSIKKMEASVQSVIKKTETSLTEIQSGKADKKELSGEVSGMDNKLAAVQKDLKAGQEKLQTDIKALEKKMTDELARTVEIVSKVTTSVAECQADIGLLSAEKSDKKTVEITLKNYEKRLQDQTNQLLRNLETRMDSLNASIAELEKIKSTLEKTPPPAALRKTPAG